MNKRQARKLHNEDEVREKSTGDILTLISKPKVSSNGKLVWLEAVDANNVSRIVTHIEVE